MGAQTLTAAHGVLKWGYSVAGALVGLTIVRDDGGVCRLVATIARGDPFALAQRPLTLAIPHARGVWRYLLADVERDGSTIRARLDPPTTTR